LCGEEKVNPVTETGQLVSLTESNGIESQMLASHRFQGCAESPPLLSFGRPVAGADGRPATVISHAPLAWLQTDEDIMSHLEQSGSSTLSIC
jgi:hypothetical protein